MSTRGRSDPAPTQPRMRRIASTCLSMGIENCRVLGTESGRVGPLSRGGSVATGAGRPPGSAGVSPAFVSAQLALLLQRDSTGNHARALLWPGSRRFCRWGWRVHHRRRSARYATAVHAGETPALPGGASLPQCSRHSLALPSNATRPAVRSVLGTAWPFSPTRLDRQSHQGSAWAGPVAFPPAGWPGAESQGN